MKLFYFILSISLLGSTNVNAQEIDWQWAKRGGGNTSLSAGSSVYSTGRERVLEVAVDSQNNYYFLAEVGSSNVDYDGESITTYGDDSGRKNIFVFSTDCEGELRWKKSIGGGRHDYANSIKIDENDNIYITGRTSNRPTATPVHFDTDSIKPQAEPLYDFDISKNGAFIIKYNQDGVFQWLVEPEGGYASAASGTSLRLYVEPDGTLHYLMVFRQGTHLDGQVTVDENNDPQTAILRYDSDGNLIDFVELDMFVSEIGGYDYQFVYDANLSRYYIADTRRNSSDIISINGYGEASGNQKAFYLAALEEDGEVIWYHENTRPNGWALGDIQLDSDGNVYFTGVANSNTVENDFFAGYEFEFLATANQGVHFLLKLDSEGELIWGTNTDLNGRFPGRSIAIGDGGDVYLGLGMYYNEWDGHIIDGIDGGGQVPDPTILRFEASSGSLEEVIRMPDNSLGQDEIFSIALDHNDNLVMGGHFSGNLLASHSLPTLSKNGGDSDFFIAKYGTNTDDCTLSSTAFEQEVNHIQLYPNPASTQVYLESKLPLQNANVYNIKGQQVLNIRLQEQNSFSVQDLSSGVYFVKIQTQDGKEETKKLIVK